MSKIVFKFDADGCTLALQHRDDGTWAVVKTAGATPGYDVLTTTVFEYAKDAFNHEIGRLELSVKEDR